MTIDPDNPATPVDFARLFDVPPWLIDGNIPRPRLARLRWALRRWWPITEFRPQLRAPHADPAPDPKEEA